MQNIKTKHLILLKIYTFTGELTTLFLGKKTFLNWFFLGLIFAHSAYTHFFNKFLKLDH